MVLLVHCGEHGGKRRRGPLPAGPVRQKQAMVPSPCGETPHPSHPACPGWGSWKSVRGCSHAQHSPPGLRRTPLENLPALLRCALGLGETALVTFSRSLTGTSPIMVLGRAVFKKKKAAFSGSKCTFSSMYCLLMFLSALWQKKVRIKLFEQRLDQVSRLYTP